MDVEVEPQSHALLSGSLCKVPVMRRSAGFGDSGMVAEDILDQSYVRSSVAKTRLLCSSASL